ncbi:1,3-beta-glucanosyltransferase, putative [Talaromyces stipitatus ATCC 10500]|uniref:1,3-beta-glucanosyltransferase n=1 Tax=Talaromyces stipitatus (strain ATCC 10500 / CBS 375.48 / QM 6759 / NRRL 1006) TaxID=441959 RepID=B8M9S5_TALSN|nr:1,3-beta-glucanosyltransferase, putative [Talaromyces stipitatus ATCC 10500]EED18077.1 1,3-beta-glucanosyltransferase, putative [Talaromyces stipitatus ATCC 10500]
MKFSALAAAGAFLAGTVLADVDEIVIKGSKFFYKTNGTQFFIRGVAYQEPATSSNSFIDPLADINACNRDIPYLTAIRTNTIRVYGVDPTKDHSACMNAFAASDIYMIIDLGSPTDSINRASPSWEVPLYQRYTAVIDAFANYTNVIGFFAGNEVTNNASYTEASAFVKAAVRDSKAYVKQKGYNKGVGYATADAQDIRLQVADYFNCHSADESVDFYGDNVYEWCGTTATFQTSGYNEIVKNYSSYSVPYFFAEYGCNTVKPRTFTNIESMYGPDMQDMLNGGFVYEYFNEANDYGLVSLQGSSVSTRSDYNSFSTEIAKATPSGVVSASYTPTNTALQACPTVDSVWKASSSLPPTPNEALCNCMVASLSCVVSDNVDSKNYGQLFDLIYGFGDTSYTAGISANATSGKYGAYSMCAVKDQLSWALNAYYQVQSAKGNGNNACDFSSSATTQAATTSGSSCSTMLAAVGTAGTGSASGASATGTGSSHTSSGAAYPGASPQAVFVGTWQLSAYILAALLSGGAMLLILYYIGMLVKL